MARGPGLPPRICGGRHSAPVSPLGGCPGTQGAKRAPCNRRRDESAPARAKRAKLAELSTQRAKGAGHLAAAPVRVAVVEPGSGWASACCTVLPATPGSCQRSHPRPRLARSQRVASTIPVAAEPVQAENILLRLLHHDESLFLAVARWLTGADVARLLLVCRRLHAICRRPLLWRRLLLRDFGLHDFAPLPSPYAAYRTLHVNRFLGSNWPEIEQAYYRFRRSLPRERLVDIDAAARCRWKMDTLFGLEPGQASR